MITKLKEEAIKKLERAIEILKDKKIKVIKFQTSTRLDDDGSMELKISLNDCSVIW